ncbi:MAG: hypothetical protein ABI230_05000, partial [Aestuariivirga sp.]
MALADIIFSTMALQNRVDPWGELHAVPEHGTMMGNRGGKLHRDDKTLGKRRWASRQWICCEVQFRGRRHEPMGQGYTSLFFLDEVTALAAGHRPCFECRRKDAKAFLGDERVAGFDRRLHEERTSPPCISRREEELIEGTMVEISGEAYAVKRGKLLHWSFAGYTDAIPSRAVDKVLTPPSIIAILAKGYTPRW